MKIVLTICVALFASAGLFKPSLAYSQDSAVSLDDVVLLAQSEISDETIVAFLKNRKLNFAPDVAALERLREQGVSEEVMRNLSEKKKTSVAVTPNYVVATGYNTAYPSYYYGARFVGATPYPLSWYNHHYYPLGYATVYRPGAHYGPAANAGYDIGLSLGHARDPIHPSAVSRGNHQLGHSALGQRHYSSSGLGHSAGHGISH